MKKVVEKQRLKNMLIYLLIKFKPTFWQDLSIVPDNHSN
jgi:hypothetical protein